MSKVSVREAALLVGKSRETINTACNDGLLSFEMNARNHKVIDVSELARVYPLVLSLDEIRTSDPVRPDTGPTSRPSSDLGEQLAVLRERLEGITQERDMLKTERVRERQQLEGEIEHLRSSLEKAQEHHGKAMLLLTSQKKEEGSGDTGKMAALEETVQKLTRQNRKIVHVLQQQRDLTFWQRLFGRQPTRSE